MSVWLVRALQNSWQGNLAHALFPWLCPPKIANAQELELSFCAHICASALSCNVHIESVRRTLGFEGESFVSLAIGNGRPLLPWEMVGAALRSSQKVGILFLGASFKTMEAPLPLCGPAATAKTSKAAAITLRKAWHGFGLLWLGLACFNSKEGCPFVWRGLLAS